MRQKALEEKQRLAAVTAATSGQWNALVPMALTVFDVKGLPGNRREGIEAAVVSAGKHLGVSYEGWIAADPFKGGFRLLITGPQGLSYLSTMTSAVFSFIGGRGRAYRRSLRELGGALPVEMPDGHDDYHGAGGHRANYQGRATRIGPRG